MGATREWIETRGLKHVLSSPETTAGRNKKDWDRSSGMSDGIVRFSPTIRINLVHLRHVPRRFHPYLFARSKNLN